MRFGGLAVNEEVPGATEEPRDEPPADVMSAGDTSRNGSPETADEIVAAPESSSAADESTSEEVAADEPAAPPKPAREYVYKGPVSEIDPNEPALVPTGARDWFILKVQSNREDSIREALERRIKIAGLEGFFGEIIVPIEKVTEFKGGKKRVVKRKLYPGYIVVHMELNDDTWFLVRETHGIGDFTGAGGKPTPMLAHEVSKIISKQEERTDESPKLKIAFKQGDRVKIREGTFESFEGEVDQIDQANGRVTVMINIFGRSTPVELEYWQIEAL